LSSRTQLGRTQRVTRQEDVLSALHLSKIFLSERSQLESLLRDYEHGFLRCEKCSSRVEYKAYPPLSLEKCPKCGHMIFIPIEVEGWWVVHPLAAGGFGSVYLGRYRDDPDKMAAIKVLQRSETITTEMMEIFLEEAEIAYSFERHPNIATTYAFGCLENNAFMIMEYIAGTRLTEYMITREGRIPAEEGMYMTLDVVGALEHIYNEGYLYRDVKPENIIITESGVAVLIDYGLCQSIEQSKEPNVDGPIVGSALYMPPERYFRRAEDLKSDIYSLGMVLYYALLGSTFFSRTEIRTVVRAHTMKLRIQAQSRMRGFDQDLIEVVDRMVRRNHEERFQSYEELRYAVFSILIRLQQESTSDKMIFLGRKRFLDTYGNLKYED
jgi:serine/threonine protein kinase/DNA-directed RNA polymerase subunit RPC12/RpoP